MQIHNRLVRVMKKKVAIVVCSFFLYVALVIRAKKKFCSFFPYFHLLFYIPNEQEMK